MLLNYKNISFFFSVLAYVSAVIGSRQVLLNKNIKGGINNFLYIFRRLFSEQLVLSVTRHGCSGPAILQCEHSWVCCVKDQVFPHIDNAKALNK